jgi:hypothetical protein
MNAQRKEREAKAENSFPVSFAINSGLDCAKN